MDVLLGSHRNSGQCPLLISIKRNDISNLIREMQHTGAQSPAHKYSIHTGFLSRREFLKISGVGLLALFLSELNLNKTLAAPHIRQGRVVYHNINVRDAPSFSGKRVNSYRRDTILEITEQVSGGVEGDYNRTWYRLGNEGYVYSGGIQPVSTVLNHVITAIPETGVVGEITIPYADSFWAINRSPTPGPRLYYASTHWITAMVIDQRDGSPWYKAYDNLNNSHYYTRTDWVRIIPAADLTLTSPGVAESDKHIEISLDRQILLAFESNVPVHASRVATGKPHYETPTGSFRTFHKRPTYHMTGGADITSTFDLPGVPWDSYFTDSGAAMHGTYWHNDYGHPHSHGCVNMTPEDARWIYRWTLPSVAEGERFILIPGEGTRVLIHQS